MCDLRKLALSCLPGDGRLRTSRREGLYMAWPPDAAPALERAGFRVWPHKDGLLVGLGPELIPRIARAFPPVPEDFFQAQLARLKEREVLPQELTLLEDALRQKEPGGAANPQWQKQLRQTAALCLRTGKGGGALALIYQIYARTGG